MFRRSFARLFVLSLLLIGFSSIVSAQGGPILYGSSLSETYDGSPIIYTFDGSADDVVTIYVIGDSNLQPSLALSNGSGQSVAFSDGDALTPMTTDARITAQLPGDDTYIVTLNSQGSSTGIYFLSLTLADEVTATPLIEPIIVTIEPDAEAQTFSIAAVDAPQVIGIENLSEDETFTAQVQASDGSVVASVAGGLDDVSFTLPAGEMDYMLTIDAMDSSAGAEVEITIDGAGAVDDGGPEAPVATEEVGDFDPNVCTVTTSNGVNVRSGPGTNFDVIGSLGAGDVFIATGHNSGWYNGTYNGQSAWVASNVVNATGNCNNLPAVDAPAPDQVGPTATPPPTQAGDSPTATTPPTDPGQPLVTPTATATPPATATQPPTETPPATDVPFQVTSISCRYFINDGATVDYRVEGPPSATFTIEVRFGNTVYSVNRTLNQQGFLTGNQRFGQAGNSNYVGYIVYNGADIASAEC